MAWVSTSKQTHLSTFNNSADERTLTEFYLVIFDAPVTNVADVEGASGIPAVRSALAGDTTYGRRVKSVQGKCLEDDRTKWQVQVDYSDKGKDDGEHPIDDWTDKVSWSFQAGEETYFIDFSTPPKPTVCSTGESFEELLKREDIQITARVRKRVAADYDASTLATYRRAKNAASFILDGVTIGAGQARFAGAELSEIQTQNGTQYRDLDITLKFAEDWDDVIEDRSRNEKDGTTGKLKPILKGQPPVQVDKPWPLDGAGAAKANATDAPATLTFKPYKAMSFAAFATA